VYQAGLQVLDYPPTWITEQSEVMILEKELETKNVR
jgi:hypothetical protein